MRTFIQAVVTGVIFLTVSCDQSPQVVEPPTTTSLSEDRIDGQVRLIDSHGNPVSNCSGVVVTAMSTFGTAYVDTTEASGEYHLEDVATGVYSISAAHPDYDTLNGRSMSILRNIQYVGAGVYQVAKLWLAQDPSATIVSDLDADLEWVYTRDPHDTSVIRTTYCNVSISMNWENNDGSVPPEVYVSDAPDSECAAALFRVRAITLKARTGTRSTYALGRVFDDLKSLYGDELHEKTLYLQVRPQVLRRESAQGPAEYACGPSTAVPVVFNGQ